MTNTVADNPAPMQDHSWNAHIKASLSLGLPIIGAQLAQMGINFTDTLMLGWLGAEALAASVLATSLFFVVLVCGFGLANGVMPLAAQAAGEGDDQSMRRSVRMGLWVVIGFGILMMPIMWNIEAILLALGQDPKLSSMAAVYVRIVQWSIFPVLIVSTLRSYLAALERTQVVLWVTVTGVLVNIVLDYAFIFGNFGMPRMELAGAAIASLGTNLAMAIGLVAYVLWLPALKQHAIFVRFWRLDWSAMRVVLKIGVPIGLMILAEVGLFTVASIMMGWIGTIELAAHGIALQVASISFMIPLSFAQVGTVRIGRAAGRKDVVGLGMAGKATLLLGIGFALFAAAVFLLFPEALIAMYLDKQNPDALLILAYGVPLLAVAAAFQVVDSLQVLGSGLLRGFKDTKVPMYYALFSYWVVGVPAAYFLGISMGYGGVGVWGGLAAGLSVASVLMIQRYMRRDKLGLINL